jgi:hypothetical protein
VYYKFANQKGQKFDRIEFDGPSIAVLDLKRKILAALHLDKQKLNMVWCVCVCVCAPRQTKIERGMVCVCVSILVLVFISVVCVLFYTSPIATSIFLCAYTRTQTHTYIHTHTQDLELIGQQDSKKYTHDEMRVSANVSLVVKRIAASAARAKALRQKASVTSASPAAGTDDVCLYVCVCVCVSVRKHL